MILKDFLLMSFECSSHSPVVLSPCLWLVLSTMSLHVLSLSSAHVFGLFSANVLGSSGWKWTAFRCCLFGHPCCQAAAAGEDSLSDVNGVGLALSAGCEVQGVAYIAAGSAAGGGLRNVPGPGGQLLLNTMHRV